VNLTYPQLENLAQSFCDLAYGAGTWEKLQTESRGEPYVEAIAFMHARSNSPEAVQKAKEQKAQAEQASAFPLTAHLAGISDPRERGQFIEANEAGLLAEMAKANQNDSNPQQ
jgi:hypothetical protein